MITTQTIIERSIYMALLKVGLDRGVTLDLNNYYPITPQTEAQFTIDVKKLNPYVAIFGTGNAQSKGLKTTPRIVVEAHGFFPGTIGLPQNILEKEDTNFKFYQIPSETIDQYVDIRLVATTQEHSRLLHEIMRKALPPKGYIKPYNAENLLPDGNIYLELVNFYDKSDYSQGIIEKVYQFSISDCLLEVIELPEEITPIEEINIHFEQLLINIK